MENPRYTLLAKQKYMQGIKFTHCDWCRFGRDFRKSTTLWHSDSISLQLELCNHTGAHKVKLGGNYGGTKGCKRWSKKHLKGQIPPALIRTIARQLHKQWNLPEFLPNVHSSHTKPNTPSQKRGVLLGAAFVVATPDSGSTRTVITSQTADLVLRNNKPNEPGLKLL